jgi:hypothetical protein
MTMRVGTSLRVLVGVVTFLFLATIPSTVDGKKRVARVKVGNHYNHHDPVHIIVNKIGYVFINL